MLQPNPSNTHQRTGSTASTKNSKISRVSLIQTSMSNKSTKNLGLRLLIWAIIPHASDEQKRTHSTTPQLDNTPLRCRYFTGFHLLQVHDSLETAVYDQWRASDFCSGRKRSKQDVMDSLYQSRYSDLAAVTWTRQTVTRNFILKL